MITLEKYWEIFKKYWEVTKLKNRNKYLQKIQENINKLQEILGKCKKYQEILRNMARNKKHWEIHPSKLRKSKKILFPSHFPHTLGGVEYRRYLKQIRKQY